VRRLAILGTAGLLLTLLVVSQLVLPGVAAQLLRDRLARGGKVIDVQVEAFPAVELLWHSADSVKVRLASYRSGIGNLSSLLRQTADAGTVDASAALLDTGLLTLRDATLRKRGDELTGSARVTSSDLTSALPFITGVQPVASPSGTLTLRGTATLLGVSAVVDATLSAQDGRLVVAPDVPFGGLATVQVFGDSHVQVQSVSAVPAPGGFTATAQARLR
jgi:hypothetical protein